MSDFHFLKNALSKKWVVSAPRRGKKPDIANGDKPVCPFCPGKENNETELYRLGGEAGDSNWEIRVIPNKYPFAPIHELIINTPDHSQSFEQFPLEHIERILEVYRHRFNEHAHAGQVYLFHNHGEKAGESIPHSHTQLVVIPDKVFLDVPRLQTVIGDALHGVETNHFMVFCPKTSEWPDEVWVAPKVGGRTFGESTDDELADLAVVLSSLIKIFDLCYNKDFPYNFYIYPDGDWYLRLIPRRKTVGGFEMGTKVIVNTQDPKHTAEFIKQQFAKPDIERISQEHQAEYHRTV